MQFDFGFRFDIGNGVGSGHFFRCFSIAEKLIEKDTKIIFIVNNKEQIESHLNNKKIYYHVLKTSDELDQIHECKTLAKNISKLIIDLPFKNQIYSESLKNDCKTIVFDDLGHKKIFSDLLFNGSIVNEFQNYSIDSKSTKYFFGSEYMILRDEFERIRDQVKLNRIVKKILLTFGGNPDPNLIRKILSYFFEKNFDVTIVLGPSYENSDQFDDISDRSEHFDFICNEQNISKLFSEQDLVISASGLTAYELACLGIPSIFIPLDEYQAKTSKEMEKLGFGINYGFWDDNLTKLDEIFSMILDHSIREKMYKAGRSLVDGKGVQRALESISKL